MIKQILTHHPNYQIKSFKEYHSDVLVWEEHFDEYGNKHGMTYIHNYRTKTQCEYIHGKRYGTYKSWYPNGNKLVECTFIDNETHGIYKFYTKEGLYQTTEFVNGLKNGLLLTYNHDGSLYRKEIYENDNLIKHTRYPENDKTNTNSL